jgi:hypothetical protein
MTKKPDIDLLAAVETVLIGAMTDKNATLKEKLDAAKEATKLLMVRHKISDSDSEPGSFFDKR